MLNDQFYQIRYNAISALNNIIISFNMNDLENILLSQTNFIDLSINLIKDFGNVGKDNPEHIKRIRCLKNLFDLYMLIIDLYSEDIDSKISKLQEESEIIVELMKNLIYENSRKVMNQDEYNKKYDSYTEKYEKIKSLYFSGSIDNRFNDWCSCCNDNSFNSL